MNSIGWILQFLVEKSSLRIPRHTLHKPSTIREKRHLERMESNILPFYLPYLLVLVHLSDYSSIVDTEEIVIKRTSSKLIFSNVQNYCFYLPERR